MPDSGAYWNETSWWVVWSQPPCPVTYNYTLYMSGDTLIGAYSYYKLYRTGYANSSCSPSGYYYSGGYAGSFRQDSSLKQVYFVDVMDQFEVLLYDFNLNIGDTLSPYYNMADQNYVIGIDSVSVGTGFHKRFLLAPIGSPSAIDTSYALIEGVGFTYGFINSMVPWFEGGSQLNCFDDSGRNYPASASCVSAVGFNEVQSMEFSVYPNPASELITINAPGATRYAIYSATGQIVATGKIAGANEMISVGYLADGFYHIKASNENCSYFIQQLIISHH